MKDKKNSWQNENNIDYYENVPPETFRALAQRGGLEGGCDIDVIYPYIEKTRAIIEPGAGYGRAIQHLLKKGYTGQIVALERSKNFLEYLKQKFSEKIDIIHGDTKSYRPSEIFDAVIGMWSHISEFPLKEQANILKHLGSWLKPGGLLILDTISPYVVPQNATTAQGAFFFIDSEYGQLCGHTPTPEEMKENTQLAGLQFVKQIDYQTETGRPRIIYILKTSE
jgi:SAM-dependent methyltransferase